MIAVGEEECDALAADFNAKWRSMPKKLKNASLTDFADDLAREGSEASLMELVEVNETLRAIDASLVREIVDEEVLREAAKKVVAQVALDATSKREASLKLDVDFRDSVETRGAMDALKDHAKALMARLLKSK
jgi:hypothetical protein